MFQGDHPFPGLAGRAASWEPPAGWIRVPFVDAHTGGEPLRVLLGGFEGLEGRDVLALRRDARARYDGLRRALMHEPRGHADMYGCIVLPPVTGDGDLAVLFTHNEGFSTMCGHGVIAVATVLVEMGLAPGAAGDGSATLELDTPAGRVSASVRAGDGGAARVSFRNVPSFVAGLDRSVEVPGLGEVRYDLAYGGAFYAYVDAAAVGLELVPSEAPRLVEVAAGVKAAVAAADPPRHPADPDLGFVYGVIFTGPGRGGADLRNVCVFADGEVDRSPTGTGVSGRVAIESARGRLERGRPLVVESILGTRFTGRWVREARVGDLPAVVPEVEGSAWITGRGEWLIAPDDPLGEGFLLR